MTKWDEREKQQSNPIHALFFFAVLFLGIGFTVGVFWGLWYFNAMEEQQPLPWEAYGIIHPIPEECDISYGLYKGVCELSPSNFWYNIISAKSILNNDILTTTVIFENRMLPIGELGKDYIVKVQPSKPYAMFGARTPIIADFGMFTVAVIETRVFPDVPTEVYAYITKDVTSGAPYASNFVYVNVMSMLPEPTLGLCGNNFFSPCILPLAVVGDMVVVSWNTQAGIPDGGFQVWSSVGEPVLLTNPTFVNHGNWDASSALIPYREGLCVSVQSVWLSQYYRTNSGTLCLEVAPEPTQPQNFEIIVEDTIGFTDDVTVVVTTPEPMPEPIPDNILNITAINEKFNYLDMEIEELQAKVLQLELYVTFQDLRLLTLEIIIEDIKEFWLNIEM